MSGSTSAYIDATGIHVRLYQDILSGYHDSVRSIYGSDAVIDPDSQDGQLLAIFALAVSDTNSLAVACYNSYSPTTAQGAALSQQVKINGIARAIATNSTVDVVLVGQAGTIITNGIVSDAGNTSRWALPTTVTIPLAGQIQVTATAQQAGSIHADVGTVDTIATPTRGWQSVTNPAAAVAGAPIETDAGLRQRQTVSTAIPSRTVIDGVIGGISDIPGVTRYAVYENEGDGQDANGVRGHSVAFVVEGGDAIAIATVMLLKRSLGCGTYGNVTETVNDPFYGFPYNISFSRPTIVPITVNIAIKALQGYTTVVGDQIVAAIVNYINGLGIGGQLWQTKLYGPANLSGVVGATFDIISVALGRDGAAPSPTNITIAFSEAASCVSANVNLSVS